MKALTAVVSLAALALIACSDAHADLKVNGKVSQVKVVKNAVDISSGGKTEVALPEHDAPRIRLGTVSRGTLIDAEAREPDPFLEDFENEDDPNAKAKTEIGVVKDSIISGKVKQTVILEESTNVARGADSTAITRIGSIHDSIVSGTVDQTTRVGSNVNIAIGGGTAITHIGVVGGSDVNGTVDQSVFVNKNRNVAE